MKRAIVYHAAGAKNAERIRRSDRVIVAVSDLEDLPYVAKGLAEDGVRLIELCGAISPRWRPLVSAAAGAGVRVSSVTFGFESLVAAHRFREATIAGRPPDAAFLLLEPGGDPSDDRFVRALPSPRTTLVSVPDERVAVSVAMALVDQGVGLIELYGGFSSAGAAAVIDVVDGRAAVGVGAFTLDAMSPKPDLQGRLR
ncbi:DUF6506 family protein [Ensifer sp.]|jgi:hypothetical protein|uniref:DUF6506 family protein n=1 Tax=Ensifer sp. TaxID=1872086 RepID=UPI002E106BDA|nr:DUF6506 family protein [Ensifer sp.]